jgi:hypothetical protein
MQINLVPDSSIASAPAGLAAAVEAAAAVYEQDFPGNYTVNISYGWGTFDNEPDEELTNSDSGAFSLGGEDNGSLASYSQLRGWLTATAASSAQITAVASLPASNAALPGDADTFYVSSAEEKALGVFNGDSSALDGSIGFNVGDANSADDWEPAALCELAHALGWDTIAQGGSYPDVADLFRYSSPGQYQWTSGQPAYFSIDGGNTDLADFDTTFDQTLFTNLPADDPLRIPFTSSATTLTSFDTEALSVIGFGVATTASAPVIFFRDGAGDLGGFAVNNGQPTWEGVGSVATNWQVAGVGDFDGNAATDVLFWDPSSGNLGQLIVNNGQQAWQSIGWAATNWQVAGVGDFYGDGTDDILFQDPTTGGLGEFVMNNGQPTWEAVGGAAANWQVAGVGDITGNGTDDILFRDPSTGNIGAFLMNDGQPTWEGVGWAATNWQLAGVGDFTGNGTDDILFRDPGTGNLGAFMMNNGQPTWEGIGWAATNLQVVGVEDLLGNGTDDILFRDPSTGNLGAFIMNDGQPTWEGFGWAGTNWQMAWTGQPTRTA